MYKLLMIRSRTSYRKSIVQVTLIFYATIKTSKSAITTNIIDDLMKGRSALKPWGWEASERHNCLSIFPF